jgi:hypothetical protein
MPEKQRLNDQALAELFIPAAKRDNDTVFKKVSYAVGKFVHHTLPIGRHEAMSDEEIAHISPHKVRRLGNRVLVTVGLSAGLGAIIAPQVIPKDRVPFVSQPEQLCEFSDGPTGTTIVTRGSGESDPQLAIIHTKHVNYSHGEYAAAEWIKAHNPGLQDWPGEQVAVPVSYDCHAK